MAEDSQILARAVKLAVDLIWLQYDQDGSGELDFEEARNFLKEVLASVNDQLTFDDKKFAKMFHQYDASKDGTLSKEEMTHMVQALVDDPAME